MKTQKSQIKKLRDLNDKELIKIIEMFDSCSECLKIGNPNKCSYQVIRKKVGFKPCRMVNLWADMEDKIARGIYKER